MGFNSGFKGLKYIYYNPLHVHVSSNILLILRRPNCINPYPANVEKMLNS